MRLITAVRTVIVIELVAVVTDFTYKTIGDPVTAGREITVLSAGGPMLHPRTKAISTCLGLRVELKDTGSNVVIKESRNRGLLAFSTDPIPIDEGVSTRMNAHLDLAVQ